MIKGIIFDMDGVLIDSERQSNLGWFYAAYKENVEMPMWLMDSFKGAPADLSSEFFDQYYKGKLNFWDMRKIRSQHVFDIRDKEGIPVKPGLKDIFTYIKNNGLKCAVATSTQKSSAEKTLHTIGVWDYLSAVVYGDEVEHGKPEPDIFLHAAKSMGCKPEECIVVEDSINGIKAGYAAGMKVVHIPDTIEIDENIRQMTSVVCQSLSDVGNVIDKWNAGEGVKDLSDSSMNLLFVDRVRVERIFKEYTDKYNSKDPKIKLKIDHTYRVAALCERIARAAGLCAYDIEIAWLSGMLHDVGRFEQIKRYNTFSDADSVDHAKFGADILFNERLVDTFLEGNVKNTGRFDRNSINYNELNKSDIDILELVIRNHNVYRLPEDLTERELALCNILRDADKIDIFRVNVETPLEEIYNVTTEELKTGVITKEVMESFEEEHTILKSLRKAAIDHVIGHASLAYELVYDESLRATCEQGYLYKLMEYESDNQTANEQLKYARDKMQQYINRRLG